MKPQYALCLVVVSVMLSSCSILSLFQMREDFIRVHGTQFFHKSSPYYFAGTNMWYGGYLGSPGQTGNRPRLLRELDSMNANGIANLRVLAASEESYIRQSVRPAIQRSPGVFDDSLLQGLDFLLAELAKRDMHAVLYLGNYWEWSGGLAQYNVWAGDTIVDPENPAHGWPAFMDFSASFYSNPKAIELHRNYVRMIVHRKNSVNSRSYKDDPTIMAWQLANEPRPGVRGGFGEKNLASFYRWIDETSRFIHSLDTNHLVSSGSEGTIGTLQSEEFFLNAFSTPGIDYLDFHLWPFNWKWFDPKRWEETIDSAEVNSAAYIHQHIRLARALGKPIVMDEFGLGRDGGEILPGTSINARNRFYQFVCRLLEDSASAGAPIAGSNFWAWGGSEKAKHADGMWERGDPFLGDPPHERQGLNSVFLSDSSTLRIIRDHSRNMRGLSLKVSASHSP